MSIEDRTYTISSHDQGEKSFLPLEILLESIGVATPVWEELTWAFYILEWDRTNDNHPIPVANSFYRLRTIMGQLCYENVGIESGLFQNQHVGDLIWGSLGDTIRIVLVDDDSEHMSPPNVLRMISAPCRKCAPIGFDGDIKASLQHGTNATYKCDCGQRWWCYNGFHNLWTTVNDDATWENIRSGCHHPVSIRSPARNLHSGCA